MPTIPRAGPGQNQELGIQSMSPTWVPGIPLESSAAVSQGAPWQETGIRSGLEPRQSDMGCGTLTNAPNAHLCLGHFSVNK